MGSQTAEQIAQRAYDLGLLDDRQLRQVWAELGSRNVKVRDLVQLLVRREFMTNYQVERLVKGERTGFFYGDYKVLYLVGTGTFARVFRAVHRETDQVVALKVLRTRYSDNPAQYGQFLREGQVGKALRHPNIVPIYEVISEAKRHFLVMEFVEGRNLREFVKIRKRLEPLEAVRLMIDIAEGLKYAFENGLTHRDLKMNNVLVSSRGQAKLVDFGLAAMDETLSDEALADLPNVRTIDYAALERATGVRRDDTRSDIYFAGCIFYHMLTGLPPLSETRDRLQRLSKSRFTNTIPIQRIDPVLPNSVTLVVNKSMMLDPARRYQSPSEMLQDLHVARKRLEDDPSANKNGPLMLAASGNSAAANRGAGGAAVEPEHSVMVVESNVETQDVFRSGFRKAGYRVLVTSDPGRAIQRIRQDISTAQCILFNAQELGEAALSGFNQLGEDSKTSSVPAVLLLDQRQHRWQEHALTAEHRVVLPLPVTMKQLRTVLASLVGNAHVTG
ncbi:MAG: serine/threonine-protein kinase [Thermoguttaceae bacterium]|jgi:serine/threonine-protein kinase|nr:serine/threonine-protein kinase [Thermoguttaceae bacterium]